MRNIHLIETESFNSMPLQIWRKKDGGLWRPTKEFPINSSLNGKVNVYITSDGDINENDYIITKDGRLVEVSYLLSKNVEGAAKVVLTTDEDLIKDGVQAIDDEFLEWFVNNPTCEYIEVESGLFFYAEGEDRRYKIFIPQEEPKPETFIKSDNIEGQWLSPVQTERTWQEEQLVKIFGHYPNASPRWQYMNGLIQDSLDAKTMYSEEEVRELLIQRCKHFGTSLSPFDKLLLKQDLEWFEQHKKK